MCGIQQDSCRPYVLTQLWCGVWRSGQGVGWGGGGGGGGCRRMASCIGYGGQSQARGALSGGNWLTTAHNGCQIDCTPKEVYPIDHNVLQGWRPGVESNRPGPLIQLPKTSWPRSRGP